MATRTYRTNLNCASCVAKVRPLLDAEAAVRRWAVDTAGPDKLLTVEGPLAPERVGQLVAGAGFRVLGEVGAPAEDVAPVAPATYYPLALLLALLLAVVAAAEVRLGAFAPMRAMSHFMGGFFVAFAFFKLLDVRAFADAFAGYDLLAARWRPYALAYPFVELALGFAYLLDVSPAATNAVTLAVMLLGAAGVLNSLRRRRKIRCACLGAVFNLPMSSVTLLEDGLMAAMAAAMLASRVA